VPPDGAFMPQNSPSSVSVDAVRKAFDAIFQAIKVTLKFNIAEVVEMAPLLHLWKPKHTLA